jgi:hypothetical protein
MVRVFTNYCTTAKALPIYLSHGSCLHEPLYNAKALPIYLLKNQHYFHSSQPWFVSSRTTVQRPKLFPFISAMVRVFTNHCTTAKALPANLLKNQHSFHSSYNTWQTNSNNPMDYRPGSRE